MKARRFRPVRTLALYLASSLLVFTAIFATFAHSSHAYAQGIQRTAPLTCPQPPQNVNLMTLSDTQLRLYGLPSRATINENTKEWAFLFSHAKHRICGSYPDPQKRIHVLRSAVSTGPYTGFSAPNWAGNVTEGNRGEYRDAQVDLYVPAISLNVYNALASFWTGVGGDSDFTSPAKVVQAGVTAQVVWNGVQFAQANTSWWEVYPGYAEQDLPLGRLDVGDHIHIYAGSNLNNDGYDYFYMQNISYNTYNSYTLYGSANFSDSESGECIAERLKVNGSYAPLAQFSNSGQPANTMKFYSCAIYDIQRGGNGIGNLPHHYYYISDGTQTLASPGPIVNNGFDYPVIWYHGT
jgi:hypothetical protein